MHASPLKDYCSTMEKALKTIGRDLVRIIIQSALLDIDIVRWLVSWLKNCWVQCWQNKSLPATLPRGRHLVLLIRWTRKRLTTGQAVRLTISTISTSFFFYLKKKSCQTTIRLGWIVVFIFRWCLTFDCNSWGFGWFRFGCCTFNLQTFIALKRTHRHTKFSIVARARVWKKERVFIALSNSLSLTSPNHFLPQAQKGEKGEEENVKWWTFWRRENTGAMNNWSIIITPTTTTTWLGFGWW